MPLEGLSLIIAEQTLLRIGAEDPAYLDGVDESIFVSDSAKSLFRAIRQLADNGVTINSQNLAAELSIDKPKIDDFLSKEIPSSSDFEYWKKNLFQERSKRNIQEAIINGLLPISSHKSGREFDINKVEGLISTVQDSLEIARGKEEILQSAPQMLESYKQVTSERARGRHYYDTGCYHLNSALTEGFAPSKITTLFGNSGVGKSTYALYLVNKQINKQIPCLYISLEMDAVSTMDRLIAQRNNFPIGRLIPSFGSKTEDSEYPIDYIYQILDREKNRLGASSRFHFIEEPGLSISEIEYYIKQVQRIIGQRYVIVTIDLLTMVRDFNQGDNKARSYEDALNILHEVAKRTGVHFVGVVQSRRPQSRISVQSADEVEKLRPHIEEIKNSSAFEERSRIILSTFRKRFFIERLLPQAIELGYMSDIMEVQVLKQNMGNLPLRYYVYNAPSAHISPYILTQPGEDPYTAGVA